MNVKTRTYAENVHRAHNFVGLTVETTSGRRGKVTSAAVGRDGVINLTAVGPYDGVEFSTDNEHATIV